MSGSGKSTAELAAMALLLIWGIRGTLRSKVYAAAGLLGLIAIIAGCH